MRADSQPACFIPSIDLWPGAPRRQAKTTRLTGVPAVTVQRRPMPGSCARAARSSVVLARKRVPSACRATTIATAGRPRSWTTVSASTVAGPGGVRVKAGDGSASISRWYVAGSARVHAPFVGVVA